MNIGIDISQIVYQGSGVARFTSGLTDAILNFDRNNNWTFFFSSLRLGLDPKIELRIKNKGHQLIKWKIPPTVLSLLWNDLHSSLISRYLNTSISSLDWFITSDWTEPFLTCKKATVVHDLAYLRHPETVDSKILSTQQKRLALVKKESQIIFADSLSTKKDLTGFLNIMPNKIHVNYPGVEVSKPAESQITQTLKKYKLDKPFILSVGKLEPRKNIKRLIEAMQQLNNSTITLAIVGPEGWAQSDISHLTSKIKYLGYVPDSDLYALYVSCLFFIYPSIWEGFGYPVIEAMKLGVPVATSATSSLKEIAGESAVLFDPHNIDDISRCLDTMIRNGNLREKLKTKGYERSKIFAWKNYYNKLIQTLYDNRN